MLAIRAFQEERSAWEVERTNLEARAQEKEEELARLVAELQRLRDEPAASAVVEVTADVRAHHERQLAFMSRIDDLSRDLQREQDRSKHLEQRAVEAEQRCSRLMGSAPSSPRKDAPTGAAPVPIVQGLAGLVDSTLGSLDATRRMGPGSPRDELMETRFGLELKQQEVLSLEDENLKLREDLNREKVKVIELKKAASARAAAWKEELTKVTEELAAKERLEKEAKTLRQEVRRLEDSLGRATEREGADAREIQRLREELGSGRNTSEMEILSQTVGRQLLTVEQELKGNVRKNAESSRLLELFLQHTSAPLETIRHRCHQMAIDGLLESMHYAPPSFEANAHDLQGSLVRIVDVLRFAAEVLQAYARPPQRKPSKYMYI